MTEAELQDVVAETARWLGWKVAHFRSSRTSSGGYATAVQYDGAGFPDLVLARAGEVVFAELKAERGKLTARQEAWLDAIDGTWDQDDATDPVCWSCGIPQDPQVKSVVWRPSDWLDGTIRDLLA